MTHDVSFYGNFGRVDEIVFFLVTNQSPFLEQGDLLVNEVLVLQVLSDVSL